jgi:hypothetical protein
MVLVALLGGSSVMAKGGHLKIMFVVDRLLPKRQRVVGAVANGLTAIMFLLLAIFGGRMAWDEYRFEVTSPGLGLPTWIYTVWLPVLSHQVRASLAVTGGVHSALDAVKAVMAGAHAVQMVSALLRHGPQHLRAVRRDMEAWMEAHEYASLRQMQGSMNLARCPDPAAFERGNYIRILQGWKPRQATGISIY